MIQGLSNLSSASRGKAGEIFITGLGTSLEEGMQALLGKIPGVCVRVLPTRDHLLPENAVVLHHAERGLDWHSGFSQLLLVFRQQWNPPGMAAWKRQGASGWLDLLDSAEEIRSCVTEAMARRVPVATPRCRPHLHRLDDMMDSRLGCRLTPRELELSGSLGEGLSSKEIGRRFGISPHTVNVHRKVIYRKLGVHSAVQLIKKIDGLAAHDIM